MKHSMLWVTLETWLFIGCQQHISPRASVYAKIREEKVREKEKERNNVPI